MHQRTCAGSIRRNAIQHSKRERQVSKGREVWVVMVVVVAVVEGHVWGQCAAELLVWGCFYLG